jgi:sorting nexin-1/2
VENRRVGLEKCLRKIATHPVLVLDPSYRTFLESDDFKVEVRPA